MLNSDGYGELPSNHISQIGTNGIDCSAQPVVWLSFESQIGVFTVPAETSAIVQVSNDDGATWTDFTAFPGFTATNDFSSNPYLSIVDISSVAAN